MANCHCHCNCLRFNSEWCAIHAKIRRVSLQLIGTIRSPLMSRHTEQECLFVNEILVISPSHSNSVNNQLVSPCVGHASPYSVDDFYFYYSINGRVSLAIFEFWILSARIAFYSRVQCDETILFVLLHRIGEENHFIVEIEMNNVNLNKLFSFSIIFTVIHSKRKCCDSVTAQCPLSTIVTQKIGK